LTTYAPVAPLGVQLPRLAKYVDAASSAGVEAVELAASAGLILDPWQCHVLEHGLGETATGKWSAFEVGLVVARQNGKGSILEARELAGLYLFREKLILHSAHEFKTAEEAFKRLLALIQSSPDLDREVSRIRVSHGEEGIELRTGQRLRFIARSTGSGRGFTGDCVILDEAYNLDDRAMAALLPTLSARPNPQLWYASSAGMPESQQLNALRERGIKGESRGLVYLEWSAAPDADRDDVAVWAQANPALGYMHGDGSGLTHDYVARERDALSDAAFARERCGVWDDAALSGVFDIATWVDLSDPTSTPLDPVSFGIDTSPDRSSSSIAVVGRRTDGNLHIEVVDAKPGTGWLVNRMVQLNTRWSPRSVVIDPAGPSGSLIDELRRAGVRVTEVTPREMAQACGSYYDAVVERRVRHLSQPELTTAMSVARKRPLAEAWAWHRRTPTSDITPLVAATLAMHGSRLGISAGKGRVIALN
jgi:phage terminase large subunit-like protein